MVMGKAGSVRAGFFVTYDGEGGKELAVLDGADL
jgi:hypothetical protein